LTPVVSVWERELAMLRNPEARTRLEMALELAGTGKVVRHAPGHFENLVASLRLESEKKKRSA